MAERMADNFTIGKEVQWTTTMTLDPGQRLLIFHQSRSLQTFTGSLPIDKINKITFSRGMYKIVHNEHGVDTPYSDIDEVNFFPGMMALALILERANLGIEESTEIPATYK